MKQEPITTEKCEASKMLAKLQTSKSQNPILEGLARGEKSILDDHVCSHEQAKEELKKWLK